MGLITTAAGIALASTGYTIAWSTVALAVSMTIQIAQAKKMRAAAKSAAEARKGFEFQTEGSSEATPVVYGRAKIGGTRVYHNVSSNFNNAAQPPNSFVAGPTAMDGGTYTYTDTVGYGDGASEVTREVDYAGIPAGLLTASATGDKNEYLYFQAVLCMAPINAIKEVVIEESRYLNDPAFTRWTGTNSYDISEKAAIRVDAHPEGGACQLITANFGDRGEAVFDGIAHVTNVVKLDRDNPQFNGAIPELQYLIEGRKVRSLGANGVLMSELIYSTNPALCLLDYLLDVRIGAGLSLAEIDTVSFYKASLVCAKIVRDVEAHGKIWRPTIGEPVLNRQLPLYECNLVLDTGKPIRENIETILATMGDARLVWSSGTYKLLLQYPDDNSQITVATVIDDDVLISDSFSMTFPSAETRLNYCNVKYHNESNEFAEDSVGWPEKATGNVWRGEGGSRYPIAEGDWPGDTPNDKMMEALGVWTGVLESTTMSWKLYIKNAGAYTLKWCVDDNGTISINGETFTRGWGPIGEHTVTLPTGVATIVISATNSGGLKGAAAELTQGVSRFWTTRDIAYTNIIVETVSPELYERYLEEDHGIPLETEVFAEGITDYYHAKAKAEELVRISRSAIVFEFSFAVTDRYVEPGDIVRISSKRHALGVTSDVFLRVEEASLSESGVCKVKATRFDSSQLAWNVGDNEYRSPPNVYDTDIPPPAALYWVEPNPLHPNGRLEWPSVDDIRVIGYVLFIHKAGAVNANGDLVFDEIGRSQSTSYDLLVSFEGSKIFGVRSLSASGRMSAMRTTGQDAAIPPSTRPVPPAPYDFSLTQKDGEVSLSWKQKASRGDAIEVTEETAEDAFDDGSYVEVYRARDMDLLSRKQIGTVPIEHYLLPIPGHSSIKLPIPIGKYTDKPLEIGEMLYFLRNVSVYGIKSEFTAASIVLDAHDINQDETSPGAPIGFTAIAGFSDVALAWEIPAANASIGGGHKYTLVLVQELAEGAVPNITLAKAVMESYADNYVYAGKVGTRYAFWIRAVSKGGGISGTAGPIVVKTTVIGNFDMGKDVIEAENIKNNSISAQKFIEGLIGIVYITGGTLPTSKVNQYAEVISWNGALYRWNGSAYVTVIKAQLIDGKLTNSQLEDIAAAKITGKIVKTQIGDNAIDTPQLNAGAVSAAKIATGAVVAEKISAGAITAEKISAGTITGDKIAANTISGDKFLANSITSAKIATGAITADKLAAGSIAVGTAAIAVGAITTLMVKEAAIDTLRIASGAVTTTFSTRFQRMGNGPSVPNSGNQMDSYTVWMQYPGTIWVVANTAFFSNSVANDSTSVDLYINNIGMGGVSGTDVLAIGNRTLVGKLDVPAGNTQIVQWLGWNNLEPSSYIYSSDWLIFRAFR